ncbi:MAG: cytochrome c3 family protein, partial [Sulfurovaceae bacterium]|nr:cytochrome c3 family protein [Sulfurovaceae bacterium]
MHLLLPLIILFSLQLFATDNTSICQRCHPIIYNEFQESFHKKSSFKEDKVHNAVWQKHPAHAKGKYKCAKCHTPKSQTHDGINCITCHTITKIESHPKANKNIYETKPKIFYSAQKGMEDKKIVYKEKSSWMGLIKKTTGSPYHDIDYTNKNFYTGKVCMGCHSHKQNGHKFTVCKTNTSKETKKESNCIKCHMPKIKGSATTIRESKTHAFHGFAGVRNSPEILAKYIEINYKKSKDGFEITVHNKAPHNLLTHPLRVVQLKTTLKRGGKTEELKTDTFVKIIGTDNKPAMPWLATQVVKDTMIKGDEKRVIAFDKKLQSADEIETILGYYIVNP